MYYVLHCIVLQKVSWDLVWRHRVVAVYAGNLGATEVARLSVVLFFPRLQSAVVGC
jgi:hypothetical protein